MSTNFHFLLLQPATPVYLLTFFSTDRKGLIHDVTQVFSEFELLIHKVNVSTTPDGKVVNLFYITDGILLMVDSFQTQKDVMRWIFSFIRTTGKKTVDPEKQDSICSRLRAEMLHPLRVMVVNRASDIELLVSNPIELCGKGRPRVFYDVTLALKTLGICVFSAEIDRHCTQERQWEVYRFLLEETSEFPFVKKGARSQVADTVRITLMGW